MEVSADGTTEGERLYVAQGVSVKKLPEKKREFRGKKKTGVLTDVHQNQATVHKKYSKVFSFIVVSFRFFIKLASMEIICLNPFPSGLICLSFIAFFRQRNTRVPC